MCVEQLHELMLIRAALAALNVSVNVVALNNALPMSCMMSNGSMSGGMAGGDASACDPSTTNSSLWQRPLGKEGGVVLQDGGDSPLWPELGGHDDLLVYDCEGRLVDFLCSEKQCPGANDTDPREPAGRDRVVGAVRRDGGADLADRTWYSAARAQLHPDRVIADATPHTPTWGAGVRWTIVAVLVLIAAALRASDIARAARRGARAPALPCPPRRRRGQRHRGGDPLNLRVVI